MIVFEFGIWNYRIASIFQYLDGHYVGKKAWAKAFYQTEIVDSAKCLFEALFTEEEMRDCTLNGKNGTEELSAVKMLAILSA